MPDLPRTVRSSVRCYRILVKAYPASFRRRYADEMALVFGDLARDTYRRHGLPGLVFTCARVLGDLAVTAALEHWAELQRRLEMKATTFAILSILAAAFVNLYVMAFVGLTICVPLALVGNDHYMELLLVYLPAFLTGMILVRAKPFHKPRLTVPLGAMIPMSIGLLQEPGPPWWARIGFVASLGLVTFAGCLASRWIPARLQRLSVPMPYLGGTLAILVCTASVGCVLGLLLTGNQVDPSMRPTLIACLAALGVTAAAATANLMYVAFRQAKTAEAS